MGNLFFVLIILFSSFLRFYGLSWGDGFFFHPDERNIASSVSRLQFPNQLNPHFFAYGSFPIYVIYFTGALLNFLSSIIHNSSFIIHISFEQAILVSRFYSALLSVFITVAIYLLIKKLKGEKPALFSGLLSTLSVGLIQFSHFGTFEMWLTFLSILLFYFCLKITESEKLKFIIFTGIVFALLVSTKISSLALFPAPIVAILLYLSRLKSFKFYQLILKSFIFLGISLIITTVISPYIIFDSSSFISSMKYESSVTLRTLPVFYTEQFFETIPILFQFTKIYPFLINPIMVILFIPSFIYVVFVTFKTKSSSYILLTTFYLILFLSQAFFFAKWTRYIIPTLPFIYVITTIALIDFLKRLNYQMTILAVALIVFTSSFFAFSYFTTINLRSDTRIEASLWAKDNIPKDSKILSEVYDLGITPFNRYFPNITLFNFYDLDLVSQKTSELTKIINGYDYIVLPSQRIMETRLLNEKQFPSGHNFYQPLLNGELGFKKIYETPCDVFCKIAYMGDPIFRFEQTANVFDRPTVFIFKKK